MRRVTDESAQATFGSRARFERGFDLLHHLVQGEPELADLGVFVDDIDPT